jgi:uncharacterized protein YycO
MDTTFLKSCDILLYKGKGFTSWLIQTGTNSLYNHVAVVVNPAMNLAIESNTGHQSGVKALDLRKLDDKEIDVYRIKPEYAYDPHKTISYLVSRLGSHYDLGGVLWLGVLKVLQFKDHSNKWQKDRDYFCSELCYAAFNIGGLDIVPQVGEADITSPGDIARSERVTLVKMRIAPNAI